MKRTQTEESWSPRERMLAAYRGISADRPPVAPELWYYYPAKLLGVDMIEFQREVPFHEALRHAFRHFQCEGWGAVFVPVPNATGVTHTTDTWLDDETLEETAVTTIAGKRFSTRQRFSRSEPSWVVERPVKDIGSDLPLWADHTLGGDIQSADLGGVSRALRHVGDTYLLEGWLGVPFFDWYGSARDGGFEQTAYDFCDSALESMLTRYRERHTDYMVRLARRLCVETELESLCIGCSWSCNSLEGAHLWRVWDKPGIAAVANEIHAHGKLLHIHFHGACMKTVEDFAEIGADCVCPFERPPGGDIEGIHGLETVRSKLGDRVTMNGNVHTVETLIRGTIEDVRREVREIINAFRDSNRFIVGTGDQVGRETPEEHIHAMVDEVKNGSFR